MSFINRLENLIIDEEAVNKDTATDDIEVFRCNEVLPDDEDHLRGASANFIWSESHKLHYRILKTTNRVGYKDIIYKPYGHWTPIGIMSFKSYNLTPVPAWKKVKMLWPAQSIDDVNDNTQSIDYVNDNTQPIDDVNFNTQSIDNVNFNTGHEWFHKVTDN